MRKALLIAMAVFGLTGLAMAGDKNKKAKAEAKVAEATDSTEIHWMTLDDVQVAMRKQPKKVLMDVYTDWCGWCKVMEKKTFTNTNVIRYINENFYAVKLNAERQDTVRFLGRMYEFSPEQRANMVAVEFLRGKMSYPTTVIWEENFQNPQPIAGYLDVPTIEKILKYLAGNIYKTTKYEDFAKDFKPTWGGDPSLPGQQLMAPAH